MPYPKKLLNSFETVVLDLHPHWWFFSGPVASLVGSIVIGVGVRLLDAGSARDALSIAALILIAISVVWVLITYFRWITTNVVITSDRLIFRTGVLAKSGIEIPLERVNNVNFKQSIFERMLGAGDLLIESGGEDGQQRFTDIRHPEQVQKLIHEQMEGNENRKFSQRAEAPIDPISQLEKLEGMLQRGTITQEDFDLQKRRLLG